MAFPLFCHSTISVSRYLLPEQVVVTDGHHLSPKGGAPRIAPRGSMKRDECVVHLGTASLLLHNVPLCTLEHHQQSVHSAPVGLGLVRREANTSFLPWGH
jgi:hypothetical protein